MSISYPTTLDNFPNPAPTDLVENTTTALDHDQQHANANDAIEALQAKVGINSSAVTTTHDYKLSGVTGTDKSVSKTGVETLTNKTLTTPTLTVPVVADLTSMNHDHSSVSKGGFLPAGTIQVFTASGTWTKPAGLVYAIVELVGPGGGGGQGTTTSNGGGGGGGGYVKKLYLTAGLGATEALIVGTGGAGHNSSAGSGSDGSAATTFKSLSGGLGGGGGQTNGGSGGVASGGDVNVNGQGGSSNGTSGLVNFGGSSLLGLGGVGVQTPGTGYGGGGSPGNANTNNGGNGTSGIVIVYEFYV